MLTSKKIKRIKENITSIQQKKLLAHLRGDLSIRENTRLNLHRTFIISYYVGLRLNELQDLRIKDIKELLTHGTVKFVSKKTSSERKLYLTKEFKKELLPLFDFDIEEDDNRVICKGSNKNKRSGITPITFIQQVNSYLHNVLGSGYTSHSWRRGIITEFVSLGTDVSIVSKWVGHSSVSTTMMYISPSDDDIIKNLIR